MTARTCVRCHEAAYRIWAKSSHAHAMKTLAEAKQGSNDECTACHTTVSGPPPGLQVVRASRRLANVQCEACHGNAAPHVQDTSQPYGDVSPRGCYTCHTKERSPEFSYLKYWQAIKH